MLSFTGNFLHNLSVFVCTSCTCLEISIHLEWISNCWESDYKPLLVGLSFVIVRMKLALKKSVVWAQRLVCSEYHHLTSTSTKQMFELLQILAYASNIGSNNEMCLAQMVFSVQILCVYQYASWGVDCLCKWKISVLRSSLWFTDEIGSVRAASPRVIVVERK